MTIAQSTEATSAAPTANAATPSPVNSSSATNNRNNFVRGVELIFSRWTALQLAVQNEWGGHDSLEKAKWFEEIIVTHFGREGMKLAVDDVEDYIAQVMTNEFNVEIEDGSLRSIATSLRSLFHECIRGESKMLQSLIASQEIVKKNMSYSKPSNEENTDYESEDDDGSSGDDFERSDENDNDMEEESDDNL